VRIWHRADPGDGSGQDLGAIAFPRGRPVECTSTVAPTSRWSWEVRAATPSIWRGVPEPFTLAPGTVIAYGEESLPETHALRNTADDEILIVTTELL
jgi:hypothetical protein